MGTACIHVNEKNMYLRLSYDGVEVDIPMEDAERMVEVLNFLIPYKYSQVVGVAHEFTVSN